MDDDSAVSVTDFGTSSDFDMSLDDIDMDAFMDLDDDLDFKTSVKKEGDPVTIEIQLEDTLGPLNTISIPSMNSNNVDALEADGSMRFFWLDYLEQDGKLYFIGKLKDKTSGLWVSCSVTVVGYRAKSFCFTEGETS